MRNYYCILMDICEVAKENATLGEITQIMEGMREWAEVQSQKIMNTKFNCPEDEEGAISALGKSLLGLFDAFDNEHLKIENGTSFQFGTVFDSNQQPVFTIYGAAFYTEDGKRYDRISEIPVDKIVCYWYNGTPHGWFMKLANHEDPKAPLIFEIETND